MEKGNEIIYIIAEDVAEEKRQEIDKKIIDFIGEKILKQEDMGLKKLAYEVKGNKKGYFKTLYAIMTRQKTLELERLFRTTNEIIKFITLELDDSEVIKLLEEKTA